MTILPDHWLMHATRQHLPGGQPMPVRRFLVIHFTAGGTAQSSIDWWRKPEAKGASAHIVIDRDGTIYQCRPFNRTAGHAGKSGWSDPRTGTRYTGLNSCSIGIELANGGNSYPTRFAAGLAPVHARHKHGGPEVDWEAYPAAQLAACEALSKALVDRYHLDDVVGHEDIAPNRKTDPGPAFPMTALRSACGFTAPLP
jgi:N-acetylmuramoyl-L-alanine amidase